MKSKTSSVKTDASHKIASWFGSGLFVALTLALMVAACPQTATANGHGHGHGHGHGKGQTLQWVGTWASSPMAPEDTFWGIPNTGFENVTLRQIVHISAGGEKVRIRLSNAYGETPLTIDAAHIALHAGGEAIVPESDLALTFDGETTVTIPAGGEAFSDAVEMDVPACTDLAISLYVDDATGPATFHDMAQQTMYISTEGDYTNSEILPVAEMLLSRFWLTGVDVLAPRRVKSVVAFGDSITEGLASTVDMNLRWPDQFADDLNRCDDLPPAGRARYGRVGVVNQGISGNRLLTDVMSAHALSRMDRDVLAQTGVQYVFVMIGINDLGLPVVFGVPELMPTADELIAGLTEIADRAHEADLDVIIGTLAPYEGTLGYFIAEGEVIRSAVNDWIRTTDVFDAMVDYDAVLRDPDFPTQILPEFNSGDNLHPNDAGYQAMADAAADVFLSLDDRCE